MDQIDLFKYYCIREEYLLSYECVQTNDYNQINTMEHWK